MQRPCYSYITTLSCIGLMKMGQNSHVWSTQRDYEASNPENSHIYCVCQSPATQHFTETQMQLEARTVGLGTEAQG